MVLQGHNHHSRLDIWHTDLAVVLFDLGNQSYANLGVKQKTIANPGSIQHHVGLVESHGNSTESSVGDCMGIFDRFLKKKPEPKTEAPKTKKKSDKDIATEKGLPYVSVVSVELDPENMGNGAFELDWNDKFITNLVRAGYQQKPGEEESVIVDRWFADVCKNVLAENFEQWEANQPFDARPRNADRRDLGDGRTEVS